MLAWLALSSYMVRAQHTVCNLDDRLLVTDLTSDEGKEGEQPTRDVTPV